MLPEDAVHARLSCMHASVPPVPGVHTGGTGGKGRRHSDLRLRAGQVGTGRPDLGSPPMRVQQTSPRPGTPNAFRIQTAPDRGVMVTGGTVEGGGRWGGGGVDREGN